MFQLQTLLFLIKADNHKSNFMNKLYDELQNRPEDGFASKKEGQILTKKCMDVGNIRTIIHSLCYRLCTEVVCFTHMV